MHTIQYPDIPYKAADYLVMLGEEVLYWGYSHHVARLLAYVMKAEVW